MIEQLLSLLIFDVLIFQTDGSHDQYTVLHRRHLSEGVGLVAVIAGVRCLANCLAAYLEVDIDLIVVTVLIRPSEGLQSLIEGVKHDSLFVEIVDKLRAQAVVQKRVYH